MSDQIINLLDRQFAEIAHDGEETPLLERSFLKKSGQLDRSGIIDSFSWRNVYLARHLACSIIDEKGQIVKKNLFAAIERLEENPYSLGPNRHLDDEPRAHMLFALRCLHDDPTFSRIIKQLSRPVGHLACERLIRETLGLNQHTVLKDMHAKRAALAAWLTWLRQNVGSCFATAPAILIQKLEPLQFLQDISSLFAKGRLVRIIDGAEFAMPLSRSWGAGQLFAPILNPTKEQLLNCPALQEALGEILPAKIDQLNSHFEKPFSILTADEILKTLLLAEFELTEEDVTAYLERESVGVMGQMLIQSEPAVPHHLASSRYLKRLEAVRTTFKSMSENALLRAWEYTLASFAESKADFATWNLYSSLGLSPEEPMGIGLAVQKTIQEMINEANREIEECQSKYDHLFATAKYLEGRMKRATEREIGWLTADYRIRRQEIDRMMMERDEAAMRGRQLASFFNFCLKFFCDKFKDYFQEVYDAQMHATVDSPYDDSPAGFRLLYKHGRSNTALWTEIQTGGEFLQALSSFFSAIEVELMQEAEELKNEIGQIITAVILQIKEPQFLETATKRLQKIYRDPKRLPWAYISGGTMHTLVSSYFGLRDKPKEQKRWVESPLELLAFYVDTIKDLALTEQREFVDRRGRSLLAYSPTHAFTICPSLFIEAWDTDIYTYSWLRDELVVPCQAFLDEQRLEKREIEYLLQRLIPSFPEGYRAVARKVLAQIEGPCYPFDLRDQLLRQLSNQRWMNQQGGQFISDELDALMVKHLPFFSENQLYERLQALFEEMEELDFEQTAKLIEMAKDLDPGRYFLYSSADLLNVAKGLLLSLLQTQQSSIPYHQGIVHTLAKLGYSYPLPLIVGDSNWVKKRFAFLVNPGSRELELFCVDSSGGDGRPLSIWKSYLNGSQKKEWGLFTSPSQYGQ
ncbi:MAG: hypothetical protein S4CHLAM81_03190 [Chlamydiales bacterium]|nr:hypothetical protein [Chlamydiales bacterium]MCH9635109.1 hypothetical protein [Chlamydiales bacterium]MCH9703825.1 hypothetical protein [Chlamydiota bacterium]